MKTNNSETECRLLQIVLGALKVNTYLLYILLYVLRMLETFYNYLAFLHIPVWPASVARMRVRLVIRRLRVRPPPGRQHSWRLIMNYLLRSFSPFR